MGRVTINLDDSIEAKLRLLQAATISESKKNCPLSRLINEKLEEVL